MLTLEPSRLERLYSLLVNPSHLKRAILRRRMAAPWELRLAFDALDHTWYAYGVYLAAVQAKALGIPAISAIEFGVAGAVGLLSLERHAASVEAITGVKIRVYGFDTNTGMPPPVDHRDCGFIWNTGNFAPGVDVRSLLTRAEFVVGDVRETAATFHAKHTPPPIGFVAFDLDYYSSTMAAFAIFEVPTDRLLPRVMCYFDDLTGDDHELLCEFTGELAAIKDFNAAHDHRKIGKISNLIHKRKIQQPWNEHMYVLHSFDHPEYNRHIHPRWSKRG